MTSLTPYSDACEATIKMAEEAAAADLKRQDDFGMTARISLATSAAFNRAASAEMDAGATPNKVYDAFVVAIANLIGAQCAMQANPVEHFNRLALDLSINVAHRLSKSDDRRFHTPVRMGRG